MTEPSAPRALRPFETIGRETLVIVESLGRFGTFLGHAVVTMVTPPFKFWAFIDRIHYIGYRSLLIILLTGAFTGMVLGLQIFITLSRFGSEAFLGPAVALSLIRELGPVLSALMVTGRAGSALTAEIGIMRITEQIDALTVMALNPVRYLVIPSILAGLVTFPLMGALFNVIGIFGGYLVGVELLGLSQGTYFGEMQTFVDMKDITKVVCCQSKAITCAPPPRCNVGAGPPATSRWRLVALVICVRSNGTIAPSSSVLLTPLP